MNRPLPCRQHPGLWLSLLLVAACFLPGQPARASTPITDVTLDLAQVHKWNDSNGDTWDPFWAADDNLYAFNCDGRGFGRAGRNLAFNRIHGSVLPELTGTMVNTMDEYGGAGQKGPDGATWKALGQECIDGVFYAFVSRHTYGGESHDPLLRQTAVNASLIKSLDGGKTWVRSATENLAHPMWPGGRFGAPFFIHYGKNGGGVTRDAADRYVYAVSNNGFWDGGDDYILARVDRKQLAALDASQWEYYCGGDGGRGENWSHDLSRARPILQRPAQCGSGPACYIPALGEYLMVAWYIPVTLKRWFEPTELKYDFYQAEHPWGPWRFIRSYSDSFIQGGHMYGPSLCARFQQRAGSDVRLIMFTSGEPFEDAPAGLYKMWEIPLVLRTRPRPAATVVNDDDPRIRYTGSWKAEPRPGRGYIGDDIHYTSAAGDAAEFTFTGTGVEFISERYHDLGTVDVEVDGKPRGAANLQLLDFPRLTGITAFEVRGLRPGSHTLKLTNHSAAFFTVDAFRVLGGLPANYAPGAGSP